MKQPAIIDTNYAEWIQNLSTHYQHCQIKAAMKVNQAMLEFYWTIGHDIDERHYLNTYGSNFFNTISRDLQRLLPHAKGFSPQNIRYMHAFYMLYKEQVTIFQQLVGNSDTQIFPQLAGDFSNQNIPQLAEHFNAPILPQLAGILFAVPWDHHRRIIDHCKNNPKKALFFVRQTLENGWSRAMLVNFLSTDLYERQGKAISNFTERLPAQTSDLAQEITKDPYNFDFLAIHKKYNERQLKDALLTNISRFLVELGKGFAYVGQEYRLQIGETEKFVDLLFYHIKLHCYVVVVVEIKIDTFDSRDIGQLGTYVTAVNHLLRDAEKDNPTIGLLICKNKDNVLAQYALESSSQPIGISEYELAKLYPTQIEGALPSIEELEQTLPNTNQL